MSAKSQPPFYRQISGSFAFLYIAFLVVIGCAAFLFYLRNVQIGELVNNQLPEMELTQQYEQLVSHNDSYLLGVRNAQSAADLHNAFINIKENLNTLSTLPLIHSRKLNTLVDDLKTVETVVERIKNNDPRNVTLKQTSIVQLRLIINALVEQIDGTNAQQKVLYNQINLQGGEGSIPARQALNYIHLSNKLKQLNKTLILLDEVITEFEALALNYSVNKFDDVTQKIDLAVSTWLSVLTSQPADIITRSKIEDLQHLFNVEQRVLAKWHSHLRLSEEIFQQLQRVNQALHDLPRRKAQRTQLAPEDLIVPNAIVQIMAKTGYKLSVQHYYYALMSLGLASLLFMLFILLRIKRKVQQNGEQTVVLCETLLHEDTQHQVSDIATFEQGYMVDAIQKMQKPEHSENQYQALAHTQARDLSFINEHHHVAIWQYKPFTHYIDVKDFMANLSHAKNITLSHWRQLLTRQAMFDVIAVAKNVRETRTTQFCRVNTIHRIQLEFFIGFDGETWFGTLNRNEKVQQLKSKLVSLKNQLKKHDVHANEELSATTDRFSQMVLTTMLQSQGSSIDINHNSLPVYRQLTRIFDWCRQTDIVTQLQKKPQHFQQVDINFKDELHAIVLNAMTEAHLQRNQVYLQTDRQLLNFANVEPRLFHRMLLGIIRLTLTELFNAKVLLNLNVVDRDTGSQTVQFSLTVSSAKKLKKLPDLVERLVNDEIKSTSASDIIFYLKTLMQHFNISQVQSEQYDDGFKVMFAMRLVEQEIHATQQPEKVTGLQQATIVSVGACLFSQRVIQHCITQIDGVLTTLHSLDELVTRYDAEVLTRKPLELIVLGDDIARTQLPEVQSYLHALPDSVRPKLFVLQSPTHTPYHKTGLYNQASMPLCPESFQLKIKDLLTSTQPDNKLLAADVLSQHQYQATRVEVLFAVAVPEAHQVLIQLLQWLGLQVHVVSQPIAMAKHWQSGRYLLLLSEFTQSPFVMLGTGQSVQRGIFTFNDIVFETPTGKIFDATKHWKVSTLPNTLDINALVNLLTPWLKPKEALTVNHVLTPEMTTHQSFDEFFSDTQPLDENDKAYLDYAQLFTEQVDNVEVDSVLDIEKYTINQGSAELAVYMIDEYIDDIQQAILTIDDAIEHKRFEQLAQPCKNLLKLSEVLAANDLNTVCEKLNTLLNESADRYDAMQFTEVNNDLRIQHERLQAFAEAI